MLPPGASFLHIILWGYRVPILGDFQCVIVAAKDLRIISSTYLFPWGAMILAIDQNIPRGTMSLFYLGRPHRQISHESLCLGRPDDPPNPSETKLAQMCNTLCIICSLMSNTGAYATISLGSFLFAPNMQLCTPYMQLCTTICNFALNEEVCTTIYNYALRYENMHYNTYSLLSAE